MGVLILLRGRWARWRLWFISAVRMKWIWYVWVRIGRFAHVTMEQISPSRLLEAYINLASVPYYLSSSHHFPFPKGQNSCSLQPWLVRPALFSKNGESPGHVFPGSSSSDYHPTTSSSSSSIHQNLRSLFDMTPLSGTSSKTPFPLLDVRRLSHLSAHYDSSPAFEIPKRRQEFDMMRSSSTSSKIRLQLIYDWFSSCLSSTTRIVQNIDGKYS